jgi:hypothetical protein
MNCSLSSRWKSLEGIADGGSFDIFGARTSADLGPDSNDTISMGAVVETAQDPDNVCNIVIVDF